MKKKDAAADERGRNDKVETRDYLIKPMLNQHYPVAVKGEGFIYMIGTGKIFRRLIGCCHGEYWTWHTRHH